MLTLIGQMGELSVAVAIIVVIAACAFATVAAMLNAQSKTKALHNRIDAALVEAERQAKRCDIRQSIEFLETADMVGVIDKIHTCVVQIAMEYNIPFEHVMISAVFWVGFAVVHVKDTRFLNDAYVESEATAAQFRVYSDGKHVTIHRGHGVWNNYEVCDDFS